MSLFGGSHTNERYGAIIDIGSGSVLVAIVHSKNADSYPNVVWAHREHASLRNIDSLEQSSKAVLTALVNASMMLDAHGRQALNSYAKGANLTNMQCSISAPWSYTVTKVLNYEQKAPFTVTENLIEELTRSVQEKITTELKENDALQQLGLEIIDRAQMDLLANGYHVANPEGQTASTLSIAHSNAVTQKYLLDAITEMHDKLLPKTKLTHTSFALMLYRVTRDIYPHIHDTCLIDVTFEATEIGIMRDGVLHYCTHTPFGLLSLAREVSAITKVPLTEALNHLQTDAASHFIQSLPENQKEDIEAAFAAYITQLEDLFAETGDDLSIPKHISVHCDAGSEPLFTDLIKTAAKGILKGNVVVHPITSDILKTLATKDNKTLPNDTALLLSAQFFHIKGQ